MQLTKKRESHRVIKTIGKESLAYIVGLSGFPCFLETFSKLVKIYKSNSPANYVDLELKNWPYIYENELKNCLSILYKNKSIKIPHVNVLNNSIYNLPTNRFEFDILNDKFQIDTIVRSLTESSFERLRKYLRKKKYYNATNLRPISIMVQNSKCIIKCIKVDYKDYLHTNLVLDARNKDKACTLRESLHKSKGIEIFSDSKLANHLGIEILLFTSDGSMILQKRSSKVGFAPIPFGTFVA